MKCKIISLFIIFVIVLSVILPVFLTEHSVKAQTGRVFYVDYENGNDSLTDTPLGWWRVAYTDGNGDLPSADMKATGLTSGAVAYLTIAPTVTSGSWSSGNATGWCYWYGKSGTFVAETIVFANGATCSIGGDLEYCAWRTIGGGATEARLAAGDTIRVKKSPDPIFIGNATWTNASNTVTLSYARTATVNLCETNWTGVNGASCSLVSGSKKEGNYSVQITLPSSTAPNTRYAYISFSTLNLSSYQILSFWFCNSSSITNANFVLALCSDTQGTVIVDSFSIPRNPSTTTSIFMVADVFRTGGGNMGDSIQSIALYSGSSAPTGGMRLYLDCIIACKTNDISLSSLISKSGSAKVEFGQEAWWPIRAIVGTTVSLDYNLSNYPTRYYGTTETVPTYIRASYKTAPVAGTSSMVSELLVRRTGTMADPVSYVGGYDPTTNTLNGETFWDGQNTMGYAFYFSMSGDYAVNIRISNFSLCRYNFAVVPWRTSAYCDISFGNVTAVNGVTSDSNRCSGNKFSVVSLVGTVYGFNVRWCSENVYTIGQGFSSSYFVYMAIAHRIVINIGAAIGAHISPLNIDGSSDVIINCSSYFANNIRDASIINSTNVIFNNFDSRSGSTFHFGTSTDTVSASVFCINSRTTSSPGTTLWGTAFFSRAYVWFINYDGVAGDHRVYTRGGWARLQTATRYFPHGRAWEIYSAADYRIEPTACVAPITIPIGVIHCVSDDSGEFYGELRAWVKKGHATNVEARLKVSGGQIAGVDSDVYVTKGNDTNWEQMILVVQPTTGGTVRVDVEVWGVGYVYVDLSPVTYLIDVDPEEDMAVLSVGLDRVEDYWVGSLSPLNYPSMVLSSGVTWSEVGSYTSLITEDFEWGNNGDSVALSGGPIVWATSSNYPTISTDRSVSGTRSAKIVCSGTAQTMTGTVTTGTGYSISVWCYKEADAGPIRWLEHGNGVYRFRIGSTKSGYIFWYLPGGGQGWLSGDPIPNNTWFRLEVRNICWEEGTYDLYVYAVDGMRYNYGCLMESGTMTNYVRFTTEDTTSGAKAYIDDLVISTYQDSLELSGQGRREYSIGDLLPGTLYVAVPFVRGFFGTYYGREHFFLTKPYTPTNFRAVATSNTCYELSWTRGVGASATVIVAKQNEPPYDIDDGVIIYNGDGESCSHEGIDGELWYYRAWSYVTAGGLEQWSDDSMETYAVYCEGGGELPPPPGSPTDFVAVYNDRNLSVSLSWVKGDGADMTIIVASTEDYPASIEEGVTVYYGPNATCIDSLDWAMIERGGTVYYSAWSTNAGGISEGYATADTGGGNRMTNAIVLIPLILLLGGLTLIGDMRRNWLLILTAGLGWFLFAGWCMSVSERIYDIWFVFAIVAVMLAIVTFVWPVVTRPQEMPSESESELDERDRAWGGRRPKTKT